MSENPLTGSGHKITGLVTNVLDGNTFEMKVNDLNRSHAPVERIKIADRNNPSPSTLTGILAKLDLEKKITGRKIECDVLHRDKDDHLVASISPKFLSSPLHIKIDK